MHLVYRLSRPFHLLKKFEEKWGVNSILRQIDDGFYICICTMTTVDNIYTASHAFVFDSHFKQFGAKIYCDTLIDNIKYAPIYVLDKKDRKSKQCVNFF